MPSATDVRISSLEAPRVAYPAGAIASMAVTVRGAGSVSEPSSTESTHFAEAFALTTALVAVTNNGEELAALDVRFARRVRFADSVTLVGSDLSGLLTVRAQVNLASHTLSLSISFRAADDATPAQILPIITFLQHLRSGNRLGMRTVGDKAWVAPPILVPNDQLPLIDRRFVATVEALGRLQRLTGTNFPMPPSLSDADVLELSRADSLLRGEPLTGTWEQATLVVPADSLTFLAESSQPRFRFEVDGEYSVDIAGISIRLGMASQRIVDAKVENIADVERKSHEDPHGDLELILVPGADNHLEIRLIRRSFSPFDRNDPERVPIAEATLEGLLQNPGLRDRLREARMR